jgi:hypothetical protein
MMTGHLYFGRAQITQIKLFWVPAGFYFGYLGAAYRCRGQRSKASSNCLQWSMLSSERSVSELRLSLFSQLTIEKSLSTVAVTGNTVARTPQISHA